MNWKQQTNFGFEKSWSRYNLDPESYLVFLSLQQNPLINHNGLSREIGVSTTLIKSRFDNLKKLGFLRPDRKIIVPFLGERIQTEVESVYQPNKLGLQRINIVLREIPDMNKIKTLETFLAMHPYCHYHVASFNDGGSLFCQLDAPLDSIKHIKTLFQKLRKEDYFRKFLLLKPITSVKSDFDFSRWKFSQNKWEFYAEEDHIEFSTDTELDYLWKDFLELGKISSFDKIEPKLAYKFDKIDMLLLREMTVNAKLNFRQVAKWYNKDPSRISRRVNRLRELVAPEVKLFYDHNIFDLSYPQIIMGDFAKNSSFTPDTFYSFLGANILPFSTTGVMDKKSFLWFCNVPPSSAAMFSRFIWQNAKNIKILHLDLHTSKSYYFYHENYERKGKWKTDKPYIIDRPLESLEKLRS